MTILLPNDAATVTTDPTSGFASVKGGRHTRYDDLARALVRDGAITTDQMQLCSDVDVMACKLSDVLARQIPADRDGDDVTIRFGHGRFEIERFHAPDAYMPNGSPVWNWALKNPTKDVRRLEGAGNVAVGFYSRIADCLNRAVRSAVLAECDDEAPPVPYEQLNTHVTGIATDLFSDATVSITPKPKRGKALAAAQA